MKERPTPETDGVSWTAYGVTIRGMVPRGLHVVDADFSRRLEREKSELLEAAEELIAEMDDYSRRTERLRSAIAKAKGGAE